jgi:hypothetical protein
MLASPKLSRNFICPVTGDTTNKYLLSQLDMLQGKDTAIDNDPCTKVPALCGAVLVVVITFT